MDCKITYRSTKLLESSSGSDSDSNDDSDVWKRSTAKKVPDSEPAPSASSRLQAAVPETTTSASGSYNSRKRKINNVWSSVLAEQTVMDDLGHIGLEAKPVGSQDRSCESYDFTRKYADPRREVEMDTCDFDDDNSPPGDDIEGRHRTKRNKFQKVSDVNDMDMDNDSVVHGKHQWFKNGVDKRFPKLSASDLSVARKIVYRLSEKKQYLIYRVVHFVGAEKAMKLLHMTEDIEEQGGMLIKNNSRRRTPGGVYLQLLKTDKDITQEQIDGVFAHEIPYDQMKEIRKAQKKVIKRRKKKHKSSKKKTSKDGENTGETKDPSSEAMQAAEEQDTTGSESAVSPESNMPSGHQDTEVVPEQLQEDVELEEGEIVDT